MTMAAAMAYGNGDGDYGRFITVLLSCPQSSVYIPLILGPRFLDPRS